MPDPDTEHGLRIQLATALKERDEARALAEKWARREAAGVERGIRADADALSEIQGLQAALSAANAELAVWRDEDGREAKYEHVSRRCTKAEAERDALRTALTEVNDLLMSVPPGEDWRAVVREKVVTALHGEAAWQTK
jgi:chromosome segregation ATPase